VGRPFIPVEIRCQEPTGFVQQDRIHASHKFCAARSALIRAAQVTGNDVIGHGDEGLIWTFAAFDLWFAAYTADPLIRAGKRVARFSGIAVLPTRWKDIQPTRK